MERRTLQGWRRGSGAAAVALAIGLWSQDAAAWMVDFDRLGFDAAGGALGYGEMVESQYRAGRPADATLGRFARSQAAGAVASNASLVRPETTSPAGRWSKGTADFGRWHGSLSLHPSGTASAFSFTFERPADLLDIGLAGAGQASCPADDPRLCDPGAFAFLDGGRMPVPLPQGFGQLLVPGSRESDRIGQVNFDLRDRRTDLLAAAASTSIDVIRRSVMIPEPGALSLLGVGALALGWLARRRRRSRPPSAAAGDLAQ